MNPFWQTWRKEIIRGTVLFLGVVAVLLVIHYTGGLVRQGVVERLPAGIASGLRGNFDVDLNTGPCQTGETWTYHARVAPRQWVWIRNTNGSVKVEPATGDSLEVTAVKTYRRSDPASVRLVTVPYQGGVTICALWENSGRCGPGDDFKQSSARGNDVAVEFTVRLPRHVRIGATTVNGAVRITGATAPLVAATVNGDVEAETASGPVNAVSVNGSVRARMSAFADTGEVSLFTVNGTATAELPARLDADVEASTVNGTIQTDYPLAVTEKLTSRHLQGTVGAGGRRVHITTVNGSINLRKAT